MSVKLLIDEQEISLPQSLREQLSSPDGRQGLANQASKIKVLEKKIVEAEETANHNIEAKRKANEEAKNYRLELQDLKEQAQEAQKQLTDIFNFFSDEEQGVKIQSFGDLQTYSEKASQEYEEVLKIKDQYEKQKGLVDNILNSERTAWNERINGFYTDTTIKGEDGKEVTKKEIKPEYTELFKLFRQGQEDKPLSYEDIQYNKTILKASQLGKSPEKQAEIPQHSPMHGIPQYPPKTPDNIPAKKQKYEQAKKEFNTLEMLKNL